VKLEGKLVVLEPLAPEHEEPLREAASDPAIWRFGYADFSRDFDPWWQEARATQAAGTSIPFATVERAGGRVVGTSRFATLRPEHRGLEIGWTWVIPELWGSGVNIEAKLLMLEHAFERFGCLRVELKTDARNERSRGAMAALPAQFEGVHRKQMLVRDGLRRDSAWYSVIDDEWPDVRANLLRRLGRA
jgi:N-acetyltransferase